MLPGPRFFIRYLYSIRVFLAITILLFLVSMIPGYLVAVYAHGTANQLLSGLENKAQTLTGQPPIQMMLGIFFNNALDGFLSMAFGLVIGLFPLFFILTNGMVIGIMLELMIVKYGVAYGTFIFLVGIMPHGIFELPAIFISTSIGLKLGYEVMRTIFLRKTDMVLELRNALMIFIFWILPMLLVAALIETFVTGALLSLIVHTPV